MKKLDGRLGYMLMMIVTACPAMAAAQGDELWTLITTSHEILQSCSLGPVDSSAIQIVYGSSARRLPVDSVREIRRHHPSRFWRGAGYGSLAGFVVGAVIGVETRTSGSIGVGHGTEPMWDILVGGAKGMGGGFLLGGIIGAAAESDEVYDLLFESRDTRIRILSRLSAERN